jgi:ketosteroid isomerase-like protein
VGAGDITFPSFFLTYWRRNEGGHWRIAAFVLNQGGPQPLPLPDGFDTPARRDGRSFPPTDLRQLRSQLLAADAAFAAHSVEHGSGPAFERYAAPKAIAVSGNLVFGPEAIGEAFTGGPNDVVDWGPRFVDAAASGDLGFTVGDATFNIEGIPPFYTKYLTVWQRLQNGKWKFIADLGNSRPAPAP